MPDPLDTLKFQKMKYPTRSIPGKLLPDPSLIIVCSWIQNIFRWQGTMCGATHAANNLPGT